MADVTIDITISLVSYKAWLTTSFIATALVAGGEIPSIVNNEMGPDQEDAFSNFIDEAAREVLKVFLSRQGNVSGTPFEHTATNIIYRFNEETPVLPQATAIKNSMTEDVKNALFAYVTFLWLNLKGNKEQGAIIISRYHKLTKDIDINLYKLHD